MRIASFEFITIRKTFLPKSMLQTIEKLTFISAVFMRMSSRTMLPSIEPIAYIIVTIRRLPDSVSILSTFFPVSFKTLTIHPLISSLSLSLTIMKISTIFSINVLFKSLDFLIVLKSSLKN
jgi:hypothetical protein